MITLTRARRIAIVVVSLLLTAQLVPSVALACEGGGTEELEILVDNGQTWEVRSLPFHELPAGAQKRWVTIELVKGGPENITGLGVGLPANFQINNRNGCEMAYKAGTACQIEMQFLPAGKGIGKYFADLELSFAKVGKLTFDKVPMGTVP